MRSTTVGRSVNPDSSSIDSTPARGAIAALVAVGVLYVADREYNDGRYTAVIRQAATSLLTRWRTRPAISILEVRI
jgi:hypothetical protein